jgi:hypothetical protein
MFTAIFLGGEPMRDVMDGKYKLVLIPTLIFSLLFPLIIKYIFSVGLSAISWVAAVLVYLFFMLGAAYFRANRKHGH